MRDEVERFFADNPSAPPRTLRLALDRIDACRDRRLRLDTPIVAGLKTRATTTEDPRYASPTPPRSR